MTQPAQGPPTSLYAALERHLSRARLAPYVVATGGNQRQAIGLYQWNIALSGAVYEAIHVCEVVLRNAIDGQLCRWNAEQPITGPNPARSRDWLSHPAPLLQRLIRPDELATAQGRAARVARSHHRDVVHADVLAQLPFGTWRFLLPDRDPGRQRLWTDALAHAFPHLESTPTRLGAAVRGIHLLRNRVAHLEPLLRVATVQAQLANIQSVLRAIDPAAEQWFTSIQRVTAVLRARPQVSEQ